MRVMIDGVDGVGKTTICEKLANMIDCNIVRLTKNGDRSVKAYSELMAPNNVIHDRSFLSELIYPKYFGADGRLRWNNVPALLELVKCYNIKFFILTCDDKTIVDRVSTRGDEFIHDYSMLEKINKEYLEYADICGITVIDTTNKSIDEIIDEIGGYLNDVQR